MPQGCGLVTFHSMKIKAETKKKKKLHRTWPAVWETKELNWPQGVRLRTVTFIIILMLIYKQQGEIDILEGVNDQGPNTATLHTSPGIHLPPHQTMLKKN